MKKYLGSWLFLPWFLVVPSVFSQTDQDTVTRDEVALEDEILTENLETEQRVLSKLYLMVQRLQDSLSSLEQKRAFAEQQLVVIARKHKRDQLALQAKLKENELQILKLEYEYETTQEKARRQEQKIQAMQLQLRSNELVIEMQNAEIKNLKNNLLYWIIFLGIVAFSAFLYAVWLYRKKQKTQDDEKIVTLTKTVEVPIPQVVPSPAAALPQSIQTADILPIKKKLEETELILASERNTRLQTQAELAKCNQLLVQAKQTLQLHHIQTDNIRALLIPNLQTLQSAIGKCSIIDNLPANESPHYFYQIASPYQQMAVLAFVTVDASALDRTFLMVLGQQIFKQVVEIERHISPEEVVAHFYRLFVRTCQQKNESNTWKVRLAVVCFDQKVSKLRIAGIGLQTAWYEFDEWKLLPLNSNFDVYQSSAEVLIHSLTLSKNSALMITDLSAKQLLAVAPNKNMELPVNDSLYAILRIEEYNPIGGNADFHQ